jgi:hypothetical protein
VRVWILTRPHPNKYRLVSCPFLGASSRLLSPIMSSLVSSYLSNPQHVTPALLTQARTSHNLSDISLSIMAVSSLKLRIRGRREITHVRGSHNWEEVPTQLYRKR